MFDSHCHLTDPAYAPDLNEVIGRAQAAGLTGVVSIASNADDAAAAHTLAMKFDSVWCTAGIHPHDAITTDRDFHRIREAVRRSRVVAVGETGLDYHYDHSPRDAQRRSFDHHIALAEETGLPLIVHSRDAEEDILAAIRVAAPRVRGVLHCFSGSRALLEAALESGWYVSFAGMITFKKFGGDDLLRSVPLEHLLLETDGPYLAPVPHRGKRNEPAWLAATCEAAARIRGEPQDVIAARTEANARRFYGLN